MLYQHLDEYTYNLNISQTKLQSNYIGQSKNKQIVNNIPEAKYTLTNAPLLSFEISSSVDLNCSLLFNSSYMVEDAECFINNWANFHASIEVGFSIHDLLLHDIYSSKVTFKFYESELREFACFNVGRFLHS
jgi:hypothetical protein